MGSPDVNPPNASIHVSEHGTDWLWAVFAIMTVSMLGMFAWSFTRPRGTRFFHHIALIILLVSTITYFSLASNLGAAAVQTEFRAQGTRQIWWVRYIQWFINFPLLLILVLFTTGMALSDVLTTAFFAWVVVVCGLVGGLTASSYKWGFFTFGLFALMYIWGVLLGTGPRTNFAAGPGLRTGFLRGSGFIVLITLLYPICWACSEGGNVISPTSESVWYGVLDLLLGPVFLYYFIFGLRNVDYASFGLQSWKYSDTGAGYGVPAGGAAPTSTGVNAAHPVRNAKAAEAGIHDPPVNTGTAPNTTGAPMHTGSPHLNTGGPVHTGSPHMGTGASANQPAVV